MISDFYSTKVPPPPEHLVRKIVPASSESSTSAYPQRQQPICRRCKEPGHVVKNCPTVTCFKCKQLGHMTLDCPENQKGETAGLQTSEIICNRCKEHGHKFTNCPQVTCFKCKNKGHVPSSCPINILEGKTKKKTDSMEEVKALQKETSIKILEGKIKKKTDSMEEVKALQKETSKASNSKVISYSRIWNKHTFPYVYQFLEFFPGARVLLWT